MPSKSPEAALEHQASAFEKATALFQKREFIRARDLFAEAAAGPTVGLAHSAQMYLKMCERRMGEGQAKNQTSEELYTLGVSLLNRGDLDGAVLALEKALQQKPDADHLHYALALCAGQRGDMPAAVTHLRRAIELQPSNRIAALNDADFHAIAQHASMRELLGGERNNAG